MGTGTSSGFAEEVSDCLKTSERIRDHKMVKYFQLGSVIPCKMNYRCQVQPSSTDLLLCLPHIVLYGSRDRSSIRNVTCEACPESKDTSHVGR